MWNREKARVLGESKEKVMILVVLLWIFVEITYSINVTNNRYRENYHIQPQAGWMNDPNGLVYFGGQYHVFYQYDPDFNSPIQWGHVASTDLVHWQYLPSAIFPDQVYDKDGCWTGSAVNNNGELTLIYAGNTNNQTYGVNIATSTDGVNFKKYAGNPVVNTWPSDGTGQFRDPKVWENNGTWYMVVGNQDKNGHGRAVIYSSGDLKNWNYLGVLAGMNDNSMGGMWECPNFFPLGDKYVLVFGTTIERDEDRFVNGQQNLYFVGDYNYTSNDFSHGDAYELSVGHDFYAAQMFFDPVKSRTILFGWVDIWGSEFPEEQDGWACIQSIPMQLTLSGDKTRVKMWPIDELKLLRVKILANSPIEVDGTYNTGITTDSTEVWLNFSLAETSARKTGLTFPINGGDMRLYFDKLTQKLYLERIKDVRQVYMGNITELSLRIYFDKSSIEVFANGGDVTMTSRYYADNVPTMTLFAEYGLANVKLQAFRLQNIWDGISSTTTSSFPSTFAEITTSLSISSTRSTLLSSTSTSTNLTASQKVTQKITERFTKPTNGTTLTIKLIEIQNDTTTSDSAQKSVSNLTRNTTIYATIIIPKFISTRKPKKSKSSSNKTSILILLFSILIFLKSKIYQF